MENNDFNNGNNSNDFNNGQIPPNNGGFNNGGGDNTKTLAIVGLVLSIFFPLIGLIVSAIALNKFKQTGAVDGKGFAIAGLIVGIVECAIVVLIYGCIFCLGGCALLFDY